MGAWDRGGCLPIDRNPLVRRAKDRSLMAAVYLAFCCLALIGNTQMAADRSIGISPRTWLRVREQMTCEAMRDEYCLGRYGFIIDREGKFLAGPSGEGKKAEGRMGSRETQQLEELMQPISPDAPASQMTCEAGGLPGIKDQVDVTFVGESIVRIYDLGGSPGQLCYRGNRTDVERLHDYLHVLMTRYYPIPFPKR
jgi:hypothetical protein